MSDPSPVSRLADALGVQQSAGLREWLLRLFVLAPRDARPLPVLLRPLAALIARELGVTDPADAREWLLRLFVLPPARRIEDLAPELPSWLGWTLRGLRRLLGWIFAPVTLLYRRYDRIDFAAAAGKLEAASEIAGSIPSVLRGALLLLAALMFWLCTTMPLSVLEQSAFLAAMWGSAMVMRRMPGNLATLALVSFSLIATGRYVWWRLTQTLEFNSTAEYLLGLGLVAAEAYTWLIMVLGYFQNAWPLKRQPQPLPADTSLWPTVDVYIPTYNEPLKVVKPTVFAALGIDWPRDKLNVYILDDGRRSAFKEFAAEAGVGYITRNENSHAKAGNLNSAMKVTQGEYIAIFDCDHIATRSFLQTTMGWFLRDPKCAMLQTPHHFFSPDPFERNLGTFRSVPNEGTLFYGLVQDGNDLWNSTFFCGSCAVIKRGPLQQVGGIAVETVTEDAHTALKLHRLGYTTAYLNLTQAAGLATESLSGHIGQRIRWARGMAQIFRIDNPFLGKGLSLFQRLCYSNAMLHFFHGIPRLVFLTAPLSYLYFQYHVISATAWMIALYALPHIVMSEIANSRMQGRYRHSFWAEVYESVLAWYIMLPTTVAFFNPKLGKFNVTAKGGLVENSYFDWTISRPYLILIGANIGGFILGIARLFWLNPDEVSTVVMNLAWCTYNLVMLGTTVGIAEESRQVRQAHRVDMRIPAVLQFEGRSTMVETNDYSTGGLGVTLPEGAAPPPQGSLIGVVLSRGDREFVFNARVTGWRTPRLGLRFDGLTLEEEKHLIQCTFGRADAWLNWHDKESQDRPLASLGEILSFGVQGYVRLARRLTRMAQARRQSRRDPRAAAV